jgi:hypothetical protein
VPLTIYYFDDNIIGRSSWRSSVGASAYRAGEKLRSRAVGSAAYNSGEGLRDGDDDVIVHDYTRKKDVRHSEIMLPPNAPPQYKDRETLWNAVEKRERRKDAQLAREFIVGLQLEFKLQEQIEVLREYVKESLVDKGMCADFAVHHNEGNPHAHIMLTFRDVTLDGFGLKNTTWNEKDLFLEWRKNWVDVNNRRFECKGLEERVDHRSYKEQGIDREPMIPLGYEASALERKGVKTERGNHNREVQRRNAEREAQKEVEPLKVEKNKQYTEELRQIAKEVKLEKELQKIREAQKTARYVENPIEPEAESPFVSELESQLKAEKAMQHLEKMQAAQFQLNSSFWLRTPDATPLAGELRLEQQNNAEKIAKRMTALKESFIALEKEKNSLIERHNQGERELPPLEYRAELLEEHAENLAVLQGRLEQIRETRRNARLLEFKKKKDIDEKIEQAAQELGRAQDFFKNRFNADPSQAAEVLKRLQAEIRTNKDELNVKQIIVQAIRKKQEKLEVEYHTQKLLNDTRPDHERISQLLEQMRNTPQSVREQQLQERVERQLNVISDYYFEKAIENLPAHQAQILVNIREEAKEREHLKELERAEKEREHSITRSR